ncbi:MAG: hypothetical protein Q7T49_00575 [bacterium]|nr:hypothetical protein [bacterium]
MSPDKKTPLPQSELEWLATGKFQVEKVIINGIPINCALVEGLKDKRLTLMIGGYTT